jgi:hypothetical protein
MVSVLFPLFYLKTEAESRFQNVVILLFYNLDDGQSPRKQFYRLYLEVLIQWAMGWMTIVLISVSGVGKFFFSTILRMVEGSNQPPIQSI